jgi:hypothetical protein
MPGWSRRTRASCRVRPQLEEVIGHGDNVVVAVRTPMSRHGLRARPINNHNPERFLDVPEPVVGADHELRCLVGDVGDAALDAGQVAGLASSTRFTDLSAPVITMNRLRFTGTFPATAFSALAICSLMPRSVRRAGSTGRTRRSRRSSVGPAGHGGEHVPVPDLDTPGPNREPSRVYVLTAWLWRLEHGATTLSAFARQC